METKSRRPAPSKESTAIRHQSTVVFREQILIVGLYALTLFLGMIYAQLGPPLSYFGSKRNVFNIIFVKHGWLWTTLVWAINLYSKVLTTSGVASKTIFRQAMIRYIIATMWWILITQWFLGPSITDRLNYMTGGVCDISEYTSMSDNLDASLIFTRSACRASEGVWTHGHDLSGHTFFLVHASLLLYAEGFSINPRMTHDDPRSSNKFLLNSSRKLALALMFLWWWMLLMTAVYFHTPQEKISGFLVGLGSWAIVYGYLMQMPSLRDYVGST